MANTGKTEIYILYQMGASEEWVWFSPIGIFLSESTLWAHIKTKGISSDSKILEPTSENEVRLLEPQDYVIVRAHEGEVPEVDLKAEVDN